MRGVRITGPEIFRSVRHGYIQPGNRLFARRGDVRYDGKIQRGFDLGEGARDHCGLHVSTVGVQGQVYYPSPGSDWQCWGPIEA